jgi:hypothetical protein
MGFIEKHVEDTWEASFQRVSYDKLIPLITRITPGVSKAKKIQQLCSKFGVQTTIYAKMNYFNETLDQYLRGTKPLAQHTTHPRQRSTIQSDEESTPTLPEKTRCNII